MAFFRNEMLPATVSWQLQGAGVQTSPPRSSEQMLLSVAPVPALEVNVPLTAPSGSPCALCASPPQRHAANVRLFIGCKSRPGARCWLSECVVAKRLISNTCWTQLDRFLSHDLQMSRRGPEWGQILTAPPGPASVPERLSEVFRDSLSTLPFLFPPKRTVHFGKRS